MMKKIIISPASGIFLIQIAIILTSVIPGLKQLFPASDLLKVEILVLLSFLYVAFIFSHRSDMMSENLNEVKVALQKHTRIELLSEEEFYDKFLFYVTNHAVNNVDISYMDIHKPRTSKKSYKKEYYEKITEFIKSNSRITFRRLIRNTEDNLKWVREIVEQLKGCGNFSLRVYDHADKDSREIATVSVQRIDNNFTFLVALGEQRPIEAKRDVFIQSEELARIFVRYYNQIWNSSIRILEDGEIIESGFGEAEKKTDESK